MVYNQRQKYSEWEFVAILGQTGPQQQGVQRPQQPNQGLAPNGQGPNTSFPTPISPSGSPFGPPPGANPFGPSTPFGPAPGPQQGQPPFGFGSGPTLPGQPAPAKKP